MILLIVSVDFNIYVTKYIPVFVLCIVLLVYICLSLDLTSSIYEALLHPYMDIHPHLFIPRIKSKHAYDFMI